MANKNFLKKNHDPKGEFLKKFWKIFEEMVKEIHLFQNF